MQRGIDLSSANKRSGRGMLRVPLVASRVECGYWLRLLALVVVVVARRGLVSLVGHDLDHGRPLPGSAAHTLLVVGVHAVYERPGKSLSRNW
jgi:hypothetical protein